MPSKVMSTTCEKDCLGVKSRKISKNSSMLGRLPSDTVELYLCCRNDQNEATDTTCAMCEVQSHEKDGNDTNSASDQNSMENLLFNEGMDVLLDSCKSCSDAAADCDGVYEFGSGPSNSGNDGLLNVPQFLNSEEHVRSSRGTDFGSLSPGDGTSTNNDSSEINIYSTDVAEQDSLSQGGEVVQLCSVHEEAGYNFFFSCTYLCDEAASNSDISWLGPDPELEVQHENYKSEFFLDSEIAAALDSNFFDDLPSLLDSECTTWLLSSPKGESCEKPVTLVLDLDETLVHTTASPCNGTDFSFQMEERVFYVQKRPFLHSFLEKVGELFRIIIFTAGTREYADHILDTLDPGRRLTSRRAYRDSCVFSDNSYTKDLTVLGIDLAKLAIVDNTPSVFHEMQMNNGIPIKSWLGDPTDQELLSLLPFLETLAGAEDVRPFIAEKFQSTGPQ